MDRHIFITGASGFIGQSLTKYFSNLSGYKVFGVDVVGTKSVFFTPIDITNILEFKQYLHYVRPDIIIHCAAIKNLPDCEQNKLKAFEVNTLSTETLAQYSKINGCKIIYISSDVLFNGHRGDYKTDDKVSPINWYGKTKIFSEIILSSLENSAILRTALVIGKLSPTYKKVLNNELDNDVLINQTLLPQYIYHRLLSSRQVRMPNNIISNPTPVELLCRFVLQVIILDRTGIFNACGAEKISRFQFSKLIASIFKFDSELLIEANDNISELRPKDISLDTTDTFDDLRIVPEDWSLIKYLSDKTLYV